MRILILWLVFWSPLGCVEPDGDDEFSFRTGEFAESEHFAGVPGAGVQFMDYQPNNTGAGGQASNERLRDIVTHLPASYGSTYYDGDPITWGHETSHGIHSELRNNHNNTGGRANGFYCLDNRAIIIPEPNIRKSDANRFVPASLRGSRYDLYLAGSQSWDDTPTYLLDEWNAYVNGGEVGVSMVQAGQWNQGWRDGVAGQLEFTVYAIALAQAVEEGDPQYWAANPQFKEFIAWNTQRSMAVYREGAVLEDFRWDRQDAYLDAMENSPDAAQWRAFAESFFGRQWAQNVLFGNDPGPDVDPDPEPDPDPDPEPEPDPDPDPDPRPDPDPQPDPDGDPQPDPDNGGGDPRDDNGGAWADDGADGDQWADADTDSDASAAEAGCSSAPGPLAGWQLVLRRR